MVAPLKLPPVDELRAVIDYNPATGHFTWKKRTAIRIMVGDRAGAIKADGYRRIRYRGREMAAGRLAFYLMTGREPSGVIDHISGDRDDNRWANLRDISCGMNVQVGMLKSGKFSRFRGVSRAKCSKRKPWQASICAFGKVRHLGLFETEEAAAKAYEEARGRLHPLAPRDKAEFPKELANS